MRRSRRTKLNWCLQSLKKCDDMTHESVSLYVFEKHYSVSKVVDRINSYSFRRPFPYR